MAILNDEQPFKVIRLWDEAIDVDACDACRVGSDEVPHGPACIWRYMNTRDAAALVFRNMQRPTVFEVRRLRDDVATRLTDLPGDAERAREAFAHSVVRVLDGFDRHGNALDRVWVPSASKDRRARLQVLTNDEMQLFTPATQIEIGAVAYRRSFFEPRSVLLYTLPRTSADAWGALASRRAELRTARETRDSSASVPPPVGPLPNSELASAESGGATAPESNTPPA